MGRHNKKDSFKDQHPVARALLYNGLPFLGMLATAIPAGINAWAALQSVMIQNEQLRREQEQIEKNYRRADKAAVCALDEDLREPVTIKMSQLRTKYGIDWVEDPEASNELAEFVKKLKEKKG